MVGHGLLDGVPLGIVAQRGIGDRAGGAVGAGEARLAEDPAAVRQGDAGLVGDEVDRPDAEFGQGLEHGGSIRVRDQHPELRPARVAGIELAVLVGVEDGAQGRQVAAGGWVPVGEDDLAALADRPVAVGVDGQHPVAGPRPGGAVLVAVARQVEELVRRRLLGDGDPRARQVEDDGQPFRAPSPGELWPSFSPL